MIRSMAVDHQRRRMSFVNRGKAVVPYPCQLLPSPVNLRSRPHRRERKGWAGPILCAIAVGVLILALAGCGGDGGGSSVPEVAQAQRRYVSE